MTDLTCTCGTVHLRVTGAPIIATTCYCNSCRTAGDRLAALPVRPPMVDGTGGTAFRLYRKDRAAITAGKDQLAGFRLSPDAKTRRIVATCCNTPLFLEFSGGHWLSLYNGLWADGGFRPDILTQTKDAPDKARLPHAVPHGAGATARFFARLLGAWAAMGFRAPDPGIDRRLEL
jgi:hypothetical protein